MARTGRSSRATHHSFTPPLVCITLFFTLLSHLTILSSLSRHFLILILCFPEFLELFLKAIKQIGSHNPNDYASGDALGGFWVPNLLDPVNKTRSYARTAYYDPVKSRSNLHLLPNNQATQIIFNGKTATGVKVSFFSHRIMVTKFPSSQVPGVPRLSNARPSGFQAPSSPSSPFNQI